MIQYLSTRHKDDMEDRIHHTKHKNDVFNKIKKSITYGITLAIKVAKIESKMDFNQCYDDHIFIYFKMFFDQKDHH